MLHQGTETNFYHFLMWLFVFTEKAVQGREGIVWRDREANEELWEVRAICPWCVKSPHTYLTEQVTAVGIWSKRQKTDRSRDWDEWSTVQQESNIQREREKES